MKNDRNSLRKQSPMESKCYAVCLCVCLSVRQELERSTGQIFMKFGMKLEDVNVRQLTELDFWFLIFVRTYDPDSVENGRFSRFLAIFSKTALTILLIFWYVVVLIVFHLPKKTACSGKIWFGRYCAQTVQKIAKKKYYLWTGFSTCSVDFEPI